MFVPRRVGTVNETEMIKTQPHSQFMAFHAMYCGSAIMSDSIIIKVVTLKTYTALQHLIFSLFDEILMTILTVLRRK